MSETTIHSIAGFCNEKGLWRLLADLTSQLLDTPSNTRKAIVPEMVLIDGEHFLLNEKTHQKPSTEFYPPEGIGDSGSEGLVWSLTALICYASSGHYVFGGRGGSYQQTHPKVELPTLKKEHSPLATLVKRGLCYSPSQRISLSELHAAAMKGIESNAQKSRTKWSGEPINGNAPSEMTDDAWPEKMG